MSALSHKRALAHLSLWGEAHEEELRANGATINERKFGLAWASPMAKAARGHLRRARLARNAGRHGHGGAERKNREWERNVREARMWRKLKDDGRLGLGEDEKSMLYGTCSQHEALEGKAELARAWLRASRPALQQCKQRATEERLKKAKSRKAKSRKAREKETDEDDGSIRSAGDEASIGDDASVTSNISDIDFDNEITFFGGIDT